MTRLLMLVEGQSEEAFVKRTLAPHLADYGVHVHSPILLWTKRLTSGGGFRGGASSWPQIRKSLVPLTRDADAWVTTLLDFYGLSQDFPGYAQACMSGDPRERALRTQEQFASALGHPRFIPFLALHEFEAWIFSSPDVVGEHFGDAGIVEPLRMALHQAGNPELIDLGESTHPKARLKRIVGSYKETSDGPTLIGKIGLASIRRACPHFADWLTRLEGLGANS